MLYGSSCDLEKFTAATKELCGISGIGCDVLTRSILGKEIPVFTLGNGKKTVVYVGAHRGGEGILSCVLLDFVRDCAQLHAGNAKVFEVALSYLFAERRIVVVPMLNPDGVAYATEGVGEQNPLRARVLQMSGGAAPEGWQANARGVELVHNYGVGFFAHKEQERSAGILNGAPTGYGGEYPESEPETAALCRLLRFIGEDVLGVLEIGLGGGEIRCSCRDKLSAKTVAAGRILGRATGYRLVDPEQVAPQGGLADWCIEKLSRPAYQIACDASKFSPDKARACLLEVLRRALYTFPFML